MNQIVKILVTLMTLALVAGTVSFTYLQIQKASLIDESLVSSLTTSLDTKIIDQAVEKITPKPAI